MRRLPLQLRRQRGPSNAATIYRTNQLLVFVALDITTEGLGVERGTVTALPCDAGAPLVGSALLEALRIGRKGVRQPDFRRQSIPAVPRHLLDATGLPSYRQFVHQSSHCCAKLIHDRCQLVPSRNGGDTGPNRGYHYLPEQALVSALQEDALGQTALRALDRCTGIGPRR